MRDTTGELVRALNGVWGPGPEGPGARCGRGAFGAGAQVTLDVFGGRLAVAREPCVIVWGSQGHFAATTLALVDELVRIDPRPLEAHVVAARVVYEFEKILRAVND